MLGRRDRERRERKETWKEEEEEEIETRETKERASVGAHNISCARCSRALETSCARAEKTFPI